MLFDIKSLQIDCSLDDRIKSKIKDGFSSSHVYALVKTYGCQQNASDGEKISGMLEKMGCAITDCEENADIIVINTCAIREHAQNRIFGNIGAIKNLKRKNPDLIVAVCGCMTEQEEEVKRIKDSYPFVDLIFGTHSLNRFPSLLLDVMFGRKRIFISDDKDENIYEGFPIKRASKVKAFVPVMYGCDNFCSYCIVPYVRGRERSRKPEDILAEMEKLLQSGYKEIMFLGQNVNSYGKNLDEDVNFAELLRRADNFGGEYRIRFMTSHPKDANRDLIDTIAESKHVCSNFHLPVQSGNDRILKEMNRKYTRDSYLNIIDYAKKKIKNLSLSSDIIVGFPGETYEEFQDTISLVKQIEFNSLFTFIYSPRRGTPAALLPDPISRSEKTEWLTELLKVQEEILFKNYRNMLEKKFHVLIEAGGANRNYLLARTESNLTIEVEGDSDLIGNFADIEVTYASGRTLKGKII